ncbi:MAG: (4Fe-4S)-binding protein [Ignavibacteriales bacterium]|nr:(4Fe-4S)-binding protein [Ignavibacteriales bacterium]
MDKRDVVVYYFSGTGNTRRVAMWIAEEAERRGRRARVVSFETVDPRECLRDAEGTLYGFAAATHGFSAPWAMIRFVSRLPRRRAEAVVAATRAGMKFGREITPGVNATGNFLLAFLLRLKGIRTRALFWIDMPSNWTSLHPAFSPAAAEAIAARGERMTRRQVGDHFDRGKRASTWWTLYEIFWSLLLAPVAAVYLAVGRRQLAKLFYADHKCDRCGLCAKYCPVGAIALPKSKRLKPYWRHYCESCMRCMSYCPKKAVQAGQGWLAVVLVAATELLLAPAFYEWFAWAGAWKIPATMAAIGLGTATIIGAPYYIVWAASNVKPLARVLNFLTLTALFRRHRAPNTKPGTFKKDAGA